MKFLNSIALAVVLISGTANASNPLKLDPFVPSQAGSLASSPSIKVAATCFKTGEQTSGMNKICYYNCMGSTKAINVKSYELCPITVND